MLININKKFNSYAKNTNEFLSNGKDFLSFANFFNEVQKQIVELKKLKKKQNIIFVISDNIFRYWVNFISITFSGSIFVPLAANTTKKQMEDYFKVVEPDFIIAENSFFCKFKNLKKYQLTFFLTRKKIWANARIDFSIKKNVAILFTSGTTDNPKGVRLSFESLFGNAINTIKKIPIKSFDNLFVNIPITFTSAISHFLVSFLNKNKIIFDETKIIGSDLVRKLNSNNVTCFGGSPIQIKWILDNINNLNSKVSWLMSSGDKLSAEVIKDFKSKRPALLIVSVYGLTEVGGRCCIIYGDEIINNEDTVGKPISGLKYLICDNNGNEVNREKLGEIVIEGKFLFSGYINNKTLTKQKLSKNKFYTGDYGIKTQNDMLVVLGRKDQIVKISGQRVDLNYVANCIAKTKEIVDAVVIPLRHNRIGIIPFAIIVKEKGVKVYMGLLRKNLINILKPIEMPQDFYLVESIPRTGSGKVDFKIIRKNLEQFIKKNSQLDFI